jgi:hypothetical protein
MFGHHLRDKFLCLVDTRHYYCAFLETYPECWETVERSGQKRLQQNLKKRDTCPLDWLSPFICSSPPPLQKKCQAKKQKKTKREFQFLQSNQDWGKRQVSVSLLIINNVSGEHPSTWGPCIHIHTQKVTCNRLRQIQEDHLAPASKKMR